MVTYNVVMKLTQVNIEKFILVVMLLVGSYLWSSNLLAAVYKYTDKSGEIHFSDQPFVYKQPSLNQEKRNRRLRPAWIKTEEKFILGAWHLFASSASKNSKLKRERDTWAFKANREYRAASIASSSSIKMRYYFNAGRIEIQHVRGRDSYTIIDLTKMKMVLRLDSSRRYFYFERSKSKLSVSKHLGYYGRSQVATIITMLACGEVKVSVLGEIDLGKSQKKIFLKTGIAKFNEDKFLRSVTFYKSDSTFVDLYESKMNKKIGRCSNNTR